MLAEVFHNLLTNAVEHNDTEEPHVSVTAERTGETVTVTVADNGPGIPEETRNRLFSWESTEGDSNDGGFGLYFVQTMVENYGGAVTAEANEPRGTVFTLELPAA